MTAATRPHVVFYNLTSSGASAIVPILGEILADDFGYKIWGDPSKSGNYAKTFDDAQPRFHWTHSPVDTFKPFLNRDDFRFVALVRDPRDVLVSRIRDAKHQGCFAEDSCEDICLSFIRENFFGLYQMADQWLQLDQRNVMPMSFEAMKADIPAAVTTVFTHLGLAADPARIADACQRHSFEAVTGRQPGQGGPIIRNAYMYRTGKSGNWKAEFSPRVKQAFHEKFAWLLERWGYLPAANEIAEYRGYIICPFEGQLAAFSPMLGADFRVVDVSAQEIEQLHAAGQILTAPTTQSLHTKVDHLLASLLDQARQSAAGGQVAESVDALKKAIALTGTKDAPVMQLAERFMRSQAAA